MQAFKIEKTDSQCVVTWRYYNREVFVGFIILAGLTIGMTFLFSLPLWGLALFFIALIVHTWSGKTTIVLDAEGLHSTYTNLIRSKHDKRMDLTDIRRFEKQIRYNHGKLSSTQYTYLLRAVCQNDRSSKSFGALATEDLAKELDDVCDQLNIFLGTLKAEAAGIPAQWDVPVPIVFDINISPPQHIEPPSKSRWHYQTDFNGIGFQKRGEDKIRDILRSLYRAVTDNGIIGLFALAIIGAILREEKPVDGEVWCLVLIYLSPLVLYGLYRIAMVLYHFVEWFRVTTWMFAHGEAEIRTVRFGSVRTANYKLTDWTSLVVRLPEDEQVKPELIAEGNPDGIRDFYDGCDFWQLVFLNADGEQLLVIENLSKPEALWMADVILREQRTIR